MSTREAGGASPTKKTASLRLTNLAVAGWRGQQVGRLFHFLHAGAGLDEPAIEAAIARRAQAKAERNYAEADRIRQSLLAQGIVLKDSAAGTTWEATARTPGEGQP